MKIAFNPSTVAALTTPPNNKDITFDLRGRNIFARGVKFYGTDTNTWRDIKINNVSIGSNILDLRNGSNTTLTNTNGVVTINSTWRPVVDNLTSDSTTSSLSAKQGKVLKALIDGKSNSDHNHDGRYLKLTGGTMASNALITFADSGSWNTEGPQGARGGLYWTGQSDYAKLYAEETVGDNLDLVIQFGDDNSNGLSIRNKVNTQTSYISSSGVITTGTFKGNLDWSYITNKPATATRWPSWAEVTGKPSSFTPSTHTHGLSNSVFFLNMPSINGNAKWKEVFGYPVKYNLLLSVRINNPAPEWCVGNFGSGILYGGSDTKGFMSSAYNEPFIMWAGGNGSSDDSVPKWYIGIKGTHKSIYNLATIASEANAAYNLRHSHANKSVLDGITSALVNSWNTAYNFVSNITGTDTDKVINKWEEIVNFLAGITEDNKLNTLLNSKLSIQQLSAKDILTTKTNNALFWVDTKGNASTITTGPFTDHPYALLSVTNYNQNAENYKFFYRSRLAFSSAGDIKVASCHHEFEYQQDETWYNVLTSKNSGISGSTIKLNGTSITVYSSGTADGRYVKKSGDTMQGVLTIDTTNFGALTIKRNDDANGASIQFRGKSSVYGYIGLNNSTKDKQFLRWSSDTSRIYTILDTSSTYISNGKGVINGTTITQVDNATNSTNSTNARKLVNWYSARPTSLNAQFGDGSLRIFYATSSTTEGKPAEDSHILHLAWDNTGGFDAQLAVHTRSGKVSTRAQNGGTWQPWKTLAFITDIPTSLKNPYSFNVFGVVYDGSAAKTVTTSNFISQVNEGTSTITDGTMLITSYASNSGFADTNAVNVPYKRKAIHLWEYIKAKTDSLYATKGHNHDGKYLRLSGQDTMQGNLYLHSYGTSYIGKGLGDKSGADFTEANIVIRSWWGISFKSYDDIVRTYIDTRTGNIGTKGVLNAVGAVIQGRVYNGGDDEGIIINPASNGYAGLILGTHNGERSVFYLKKGNPFWRYNNGSTNLDIYHPKKSGTIALTSDIPDKNSWNYDDRYLKLTGGWMSGNINFGGDNKIYWGRNTDSASISFKNDGDGDANSYMSFVTSDNGNEYFRWSHNSGSTNTEWMALRSDGLRVRGTKVSLEGHSHNDLYYTKAESNAKYITDITTSVNKLTFTKNGANITRDITVNVVHSQGYLTNIPNKDATTKASPGLLIYNSYNQTIGTNSCSSVLSINTGGTIQIAGDWGDDRARNLYWRSQSDRNVADYPWKSWRTILDSENYSFTLDSRYYTESEVNSLLDAKLNRQNLSYGNWNPRGWNLAADYHYNGGDISISENNGKMYVSVDGCFWQNEGQYRVLDTSDIGDIRDSVTLHQYLSATDAAWYPLVWGEASHNNTSDSTGPIYKSYDKLSWQTSSQTLYATNIQTNNIKNLSIGGGIYWNPNVEAASDGSDAASITLVRSGVAGGTTLVLSQQNDTNDTIQFKTNTAVRLYHNNYPILTTQNTYVSNNKGYINGTEITQVNNADKVDNRHAISTTPNTGIIYKAAIYTSYSLTSYWVRLASIPSIGQNGEFVATIHVQSGHSNPGRSAILLVYLRGNASSFMSKSFKICCNSNYDPNRFRLYYKDSDKTSEIWYHTTGQWDGIITTVISQSEEGYLYEGLTLYSGSITAVQTPSVSTYLSAQVSTITDNISGNASTATKLQTPRTIWGQSFDGTGNVSDSLSEVGNIHFKVDGSYDIGSDAAASRYIYTHWLGARSGRKLELGANNSEYGKGLCIDTNLNVGIGTNAPAYKLHVNGTFRATNSTVSDLFVNTGDATLKIYTGITADTQNDGNICFQTSIDATDGQSHAYPTEFQHRCNIVLQPRGGQVYIGTNPGIGNTTYKLYVNSKIFSNGGFVKNGSSDSYVLLGGGGHKAISDFAISTHTHTVFKNNLMIKGTNGLSDSASIHLGIGDSDTGFKWISDGVCQIYANNAAVGQWTSGGMDWFKNPTVNGNKVWNAGNDGSGSGLDADTLDGYHAASFVKMKQFRFNQYKKGFWTKILTITINSTSDLQPVIAFNWIPSECAREVWAEFTINWRSNSPIFYAIWKGTAVRTLTCVNSSGNIWNVWVQGDKNSYDPFGEVQVTYAHNISSYNGGSLGYSDSDPGGTRCTLGGYVNYARSTGNADTVDGQHASAFSYKSWWHWYGKDGQPNWLWGGNNENDYYVYNPSNFRVAYASSAGNADTVDGEHASNFSYTHQSSFDFSKGKSGRIVTFDQSNTDYGWINGFASTHNNYLTSVIFNTHRTSDWYVGYIEAHSGITNGLQAVHKLALADGDESYPIFLGYLNLYNGNDGTISSSFPCLGYSVPFTYTRGGAYCLINIPDTTHQVFYIKAAIASVHYSGAGMGHWVGNHRGDGAWWLHCDAVGSNAVQVKGFHPANGHNDSWWGGNPLYSGFGAAKIITVCLFGHVKYK